MRTYAKSGQTRKARHPRKPSTSSGGASADRALHESDFEVTARKLRTFPMSTWQLLTPDGMQPSMLAAVVRSKLNYQKSATLARQWLQRLENAQNGFIQPLNVDEWYTYGPGRHSTRPTAMRVVDEDDIGTQATVQETKHAPSVSPSSNRSACWSAELSVLSTWLHERERFWHKQAAQHTTSHLAQQHYQQAAFEHRTLQQLLQQPEIAGQATSSIMLSLLHAMESPAPVTSTYRRVRKSM